MTHPVGIIRIFYHLPNSLPIHGIDATSVLYQLLLQSPNLC